MQSRAPRPAGNLNGKTAQKKQRRSAAELRTNLKVGAVLLVALGTVLGAASLSAFGTKSPHAPQVATASLVGGVGSQNRETPPDMTRLQRELAYTNPQGVNPVAGLAKMDGYSDADATRMAAQVTPASTSTSITTDYVYDGQNMVREMQHGVPTATYLTGPRGPEYRRDDTKTETDGQGHTFGKTRWYVYDGQSNVVGEVDPLGNLTASTKYDVFGGVRGGTGTASTAHGFAGGVGHLSEPSTGLIYMRARYYDPVLGRFQSEDPGRHGANWFAYTGNNPVNNVDPSGKEDLSETLFASNEGMSLDSLGLSELDGTCYARGDTMHVVVDWIQAVEQGSMDKEGFVEGLENMAEDNGCNAVRWTGQSQPGSPGYRMKEKIAEQILGDKDCFSHENGVTMLEWLFTDD